MFPSQASERDLGLFKRYTVAALGTALSRRALASWVRSWSWRLIANAIGPGASNAEAVLGTTRTASAVLSADGLLAAVVGIASGGVLSRPDVVGVIALDHVTELLGLLIENPPLITRSAVCVTRDESVVFVPASDPSHVVNPEETGLDFFAFVVLDHDGLLSLVELRLQEVTADGMRVLEWNRLVQWSVFLAV